MVKNMKESGRKIKDMVKVYIPMQMEVDTNAYGIQAQKILAKE